MNFNDPLIGVWIWMETHPTGKHCIGELHVSANGTCSWRERGELQPPLSGGTLTPADNLDTNEFDSAIPSNDVQMTWKRLSDQVATIHVSNRGFTGTYYLHISADQKMATLMRVNSPRDPLCNDLDFAIAFKDDSGEGTMPFLKEAFGY